MSDRALLFDCDGVLADTERLGHLAAFNQLFIERDLGVHWSDSDYSLLLKIGGGKERMQTLFDDQDFRIRNDVPPSVAGRASLLADWHSRKTEIFIELVAEGRVPGRPGVKRLACEAHAGGWKLAVVSTSAEASVRAIACRVFPAEITASLYVFAGDIVPTKKPAPDIYMLALRHLGMQSSEVCVIEDSGVGYAAARAAGCPTIVTVSDFTSRENFEGAVLVVDSLGDARRPASVVSTTLEDPPGDLVTLKTVQSVMRRTTIA